MLNAFARDLGSLNDGCHYGPAGRSFFMPALQCQARAVGYPAPERACQALHAWTGFFQWILEVLHVGATRAWRAATWGGS